MTLGEYKALNPDMKACYKEAGEDIKGGFGRKGYSLYGNCDDLEIMDIVQLSSYGDIPTFILGNP